MKKIRLAIILLVFTAALATGLWLWLRPEAAPREEIKIEEGRIVDLRPIAELCSMEIYREVAVRDTVNGKVLYGVQKQQGRITFDLSGLPSDVSIAISSDMASRNDTLTLQLPKENVSLKESVSDDSWRVVGTKSTHLFRSSKLTLDEENIIKRRAINRGVKQLYRDGTVARARREAAVTLKRMAEAMTGRPVKVVNGSYQQ